MFHSTFWGGGVGGGVPTFAVDNRVSKLFCCQEREKRSRSNDEPRRKGNNRGKATLSGPCPIEGGREWPHLADWAPKVRCDDQGSDEAVCIGELSNGA